VETPAVVLPLAALATAPEEATVAPLPALDEPPVMDAEPEAASAFAGLALPPDPAPIPSFTPVPAPPPGKQALFARGWEEPSAEAEPTLSPDLPWPPPPSPQLPKPGPPVAEEWAETDAVPADRQPGEALELAGPAAFVPWNTPPADETADLALEADLGAFEVESGPAAALATGVSSSAPSSVDDRPLELAPNSDFIPELAPPAFGQPFAPDDVALDFTEELGADADDEVIQGEAMTPSEESSDLDLDVEDLMRPSASPPVRARPPAAEATASFAVPPLVALARPTMPLATQPAVPAPALSPPGAITAAAAAGRLGVLPNVIPRDPPSSSLSGVGLVRGEDAPVPVPGEHRVILHTMEGGVKRGALKDANLAAPQVVLLTNPGVSESVPRDRVKAIFFMLAPGSRAPAPDGLKVRVTFRDGRQVAGFSRDHRSGAAGFFVVPADARTNTERIFIYRHGVTSVSVES
jgi:hypothetical protein